MVRGGGGRQVARLDRHGDAAHALPALAHVGARVEVLERGTGVRGAAENGDPVAAQGIGEGWLVGPRQLGHDRGPEAQAGIGQGRIVRGAARRRAVRPALDDDAVVGDVPDDTNVIVESAMDRHLLTRDSKGRRRRRTGFAERADGVDPRREANACGLCCDLVTIALASGFLNTALRPTRIA
jgi:hypothetical protein